MGIGVPIAYYFLNFSWNSSFLLASMFASHTLLAYPIVSRLGISQSESVNVTVGGTLITDTAALLILAIVVGSTKGDLDLLYWAKLFASILSFGVFVVFLFPIIARWFLKQIHDNVSQYIFVLAMVFLGAFLAELAGLEAIIGAFLAGLSLNRLIPHTSPLMNRIEFVGNSLFIPFFLISVGMLVDLRILLREKEALYTAGIMITVALLAKWLAAFFSQIILKYKAVDRSLIFGLSSAQAAATLAVVLVGYQLELLNKNVLNGTILMILVTCLVSSFVTEKAARSIALEQEKNEPELDEITERILVPISNPGTIENLINTAVMLRNSGSKQPIYALSVVREDSEAKDKVFEANKMLEKAVKLGSATDTTVQIITRVDLNIANGIQRACKDIVATDILIGWNSKISARDRIFGSVLDSLIRKNSQNIWVSHWIGKGNTAKKICILMPENAEHEPGFSDWLKKTFKLSKELGAIMEIRCSEKTRQRIERLILDNKLSISPKFEKAMDWDDLVLLSKELSSDDLLILLQARKGSISYNKEMDETPKKLSKHFVNHNFIVAYPSSLSEKETEGGFSSYDSFITPIQENLERFRKATRLLGRILKS